jgi:carbon monoxide dehydrogenase subunit G
MLVDISKEASINVSQAEAWALLRDVSRLSACMPNISNVQVLEEDRRYAAVVSDRIGPFTLSLPVNIEVTAVEPPRRITANLAGDDKRGQARVRGRLEATADATNGSTELRMAMHVEILGRLATLGAVPIRRRADEVLSEFVQNVSRSVASA